MTLHLSSSKPYHLHREKQRERILDAAERLFIQNGLDNVSFSAIARATGLTRNTLYEYFPNKQEVAWAIFQQIMEDGREIFAAHPAQTEENGFQRVERFMLQMSALLETQPQHLRFIVEFNTLYAREGDHARVRQAWAEGDDRLERMIRQGIEDGSIRKDRDPKLITAAVRNLLSGMNSRFALLGDLIQDEFDQPVKEIYQEICQAFLRGIQAPLQETQE